MTMIKTTLNIFLELVIPENSNEIEIITIDCDHAIQTFFIPMFTGLHHEFNLIVMFQMVPQM